MGFDIEEVFREIGNSGPELHSQHINPQWMRVLRTIGFQRHFVRCEGAHLFDAEGNRYLDFMAGWGVFNFGRRHPTIVKTLETVLTGERPGWVVFDAPPLAGRLAQELKRRIPYDLGKVYFGNSGAEAVEAALKIARVATGRSRILHQKGSFHGLTNGALAVTGDASFRDGFDPYFPGCSAIPQGDLDALEREVRSGDVAAFIFEPIRGKGVYAPEKGWLKDAQDLCRRHGTLLIADEIQTGMGRTGRFLATEWEEGVEPDLVLMAKALSGGYVPIGVVLMRDALYEAVYTSMDRAIRHACTFGMGDMAMAAGLASLHVLDEEDCLANANRLGQRFKEGLEALKQRFEFIGDIRQHGLMIGIEFREPKSLGLKTAWKTVHAMDRNLFAQAVTIPLMDDHRILSQVAGHEMAVVKLLPPLTITDADVDWFLKSFEEVMTTLHRFPGPAWEVLKKLGKHAITARLRK